MSKWTKPPRGWKVWIRCKFSFTSEPYWTWSVGTGRDDDLAKPRRYPSRDGALRAARRFLDAINMNLEIDG